MLFLNSTTLTGLLLCLFFPNSIYAVDFSKGDWVDLTHEFSEQAIYWPTADEFKKTTVFRGKTDAGFYYEAYNYCGAEHGGTHIDAPIHFAANHKTVDQIPVKQLIGQGIVIRITQKVAQDRNYQLKVDDLLDWERKHGIIPNDSILLIDTGSSRYWPDKQRYMGTAKRGPEGVAELKFPGLHPQAAKFLVTDRRIKAIGLDTPSIDFGGSKLFQSHQILYMKNVPAFENVANLDQLPIAGFTVIALPMKIKGGSGAPLRIVAFIPDS
jgi:kynurenine formamidase